VKTIQACIVKRRHFWLIHCGDFDAIIASKNYPITNRRSKYLILPTLLHGNGTRTAEYAEPRTCLKIFEIIKA
jgi:hypothetical protein